MSRPVYDKNNEKHAALVHAIHKAAEYMQKAKAAKKTYDAAKKKGDRDAALKAMLLWDDANKKSKAATKQMRDASKGFTTPALNSATQDAHDLVVKRKVSLSRTSALKNWVDVRDAEEKINDANKKIAKLEAELKSVQEQLHRVQPWKTFFTENWYRLSDDLAFEFSDLMEATKLSKSSSIRRQSSQSEWHAPAEVGLSRDWLNPAGGKRRSKKL